MAVRFPRRSHRLGRVNLRTSQLQLFATWLSCSLVLASSATWAQTRLKPIGDDCSPTGISSACTTENPANSEYCITQDNFGTPPSALENPDVHDWFQGYCSQSCVPGGSCPAGSACSPTNSRLPQFSCLKRCTVGGNDCRPRYSCDPSFVAAGATAPAPVCVPSCFSDADCQERLGSFQFACRPCDRICVPKNTPTAVVGDRCTDDSKCGIGQTCLKLTSGVDGICSQRCGTGVICSCPTGSSCQAAGPNGESYCLRTCSSGSCPADTGLTCAAFGTTKACLPPCSNDNQCPVNLKCLQGACRGTDADGGCALCGVPGVGSKPGYGGTGGTGPTPPSSAGCTATESGLLGMLALGAMLLPLLRRRRS